MDKIFIDSSAYIAVYNNRDSNNREAISKAAEILKEKVRGVSSNFVTDEVLTNLLVRARYRDAVGFGKTIFETASEIEYVTIDDTIEKEAWEVFKKYNRDKFWSFTDCTSFVVMRDMGIKIVFTFDRRDFRQMGFKVL